MLITLFKFLSAPRLRGEYLSSRSPFIVRPTDCGCGYMLYMLYYIVSFLYVNKIGELGIEPKRSSTQMKRPAIRLSSVGFLILILKK